MNGPNPDNFKELRLVEGFNKSELAEEAGVSRTTIDKIESGDYESEPHGKTYGKLADALDMDTKNLRAYVLSSIGLDGRDE